MPVGLFMHRIKLSDAKVDARARFGGELLHPGASLAVEPNRHQRTRIRYPASTRQNLRRKTHSLAACAEI